MNIRGLKIVLILNVWVFNSSLVLLLLRMLLVHLLALHLLIAFESCQFCEFPFIKHLSPLTQLPFGRSVAMLLIRPLMLFGSELIICWYFEDDFLVQKRYSIWKCIVREFLWVFQQIVKQLKSVNNGVKIVIQELAPDRIVTVVAFDSQFVIDEEELLLKLQNVDVSHFELLAYNKSGFSRARTAPRRNKDQTFRDLQGWHVLCGVGASQSHHRFEWLKSVN